MTDDADRILLLDDLTGLAHKYELGQGDESLCDCDLLQEAYELERTSIIWPRHLDAGVWGRAECLDPDTDHNSKQTQ